MTPHILVIGSGIGGLTTAALLAQQGYKVTVLEAQTYPGGCASTFYYQGYYFESGATLAGGFQSNGPHALVGKQLGIAWPLHRCEPAWVVHLPDRQVTLSADYTDILKKFPHTAKFWQQQTQIADLCWEMSAQGLPWPPTSLAELYQLAKVGLWHFPHDVRLLPFAFSTVKDWLKRHHLVNDTAFKRFIDAQLLISAQTISDRATALYGATALDLARQGVYHIEGGIGGIAEILVTKIRDLGGEVIYRHCVTSIQVKNDRVTGVYVMKGRHDTKGTFFPCDFLVANVTPWSLDELLGENSPSSLKRETTQRKAGWGAFVLHVGVDELPTTIPSHHQVIADWDNSLGEGRSIFMSVSPTRRSVTITTHTAVQPWWELLAHNPQAYTDRKAVYTERMLTLLERAMPGFRQHIHFTLAGSPVTYNLYTGRHLGMVGGFPQTSLFKARGPKTGITNVRLVGDSIFPGQSTAGVTLGAIRVAADIQRTLAYSHKHFPLMEIIRR